ncbi:MAG: tRNA (adenosine(37)-N6)-threonylcarbamoyltransferase complex dimerization subunit type 1 TsaB [Mariprofundaceae bacterium]
MSYPLLALDVSTGPACACLITESGAIFKVEAEAGLQHSQTVLPLLQGLMQQAAMEWGDLKMLVLSQGPGSFTGLRIGASILAGINASLHLPTLGVSSLAITAAQSDCSEALWVLEDARAGEVFVGCYQDQQALQQDVCRSWDEVLKMQAGCYCALQPAACELADWQYIEPQRRRVDALILCVQKEYQSTDIKLLSEWIEPVYLQLSQAEKNLKNA